MNSFQIISKTEKDTTSIAKIISSHIKQADVILLDGDLGTGKTFFVKAYAKAIGSESLVTSPTFNIANFYNTNSCDILHIDLYRLENTNEFWQLGLFEYFQETIVFIEWGIKIEEELDDFIKITFEHSKNEERLIIFSCKGEKYLPTIENFKKKLSSL